MPEKESKHKLKDRHRIYMAIVINLVICLICAVFLVPEAMNNDDYIIQSIISGAFGVRSPELAHTNWIYGNVLVALQNVSPTLNWFEIINYSMLFVAVTLVFCIIWIQNKNISGFVLALCFSLFIGPIFYNELHNSKEVPFIAAAALFAVLFGIKERKNVFCVVGGVLALLSSWVRFHAFLVGAAFVFGSCVLYPVLMIKDGEKNWLKEGLKTALIFLIVFTLIFGTWFFDKRVEAANPSLQNYREYNAVRGAVSDYDIPDFSEHYAEYAALSLTDNDCEMIRIWDFADSEKFSVDVLLQIAQIREAVTKKEAVSRMITELLSGAVSNPLQIAFGMLFVIALIMTRRTEKNDVIWMAIAFLGCYLFMCLTGRTTRWVTAGLIAAGLTGLFVSIKWKKGSLSVICSIILLIAVLVFDAVTLIPEIADYSKSFNKSAGRIYTDLGEREENLYLMDHNSAPPLQRITPIFSSVEPGLFKNTYVLGGWDTESAAKNSVLDRYQVFGSPYRALIEKRNVFLADTQNATTILRYVRENYAPNATMAVQETIDGYCIYAFTNQSVNTDDTSFQIIDAAASVDTSFGSFLYVGAIFNTDIKESDTIYVCVSDQNGTERIYRAGSLERNDGNKAAVLWIPLTDYPLPNGLSFKVLIESENGSVRGSEVFIQS
ncbi:MAG: hypothetical protein IJH64_13685 [Oscillospiraceae bacterium]|nr:hypothetical protein [Oscillospiraceae bacterium]MBR0451045.1 hypothetical protein [Oscillospiraceae bacterium]